jgi:hypothetical protein
LYTFRGREVVKKSTLCTLVIMEYTPPSGNRCGQHCLPELSLFNLIPGRTMAIMAAARVVRPYFPKKEIGVLNISSAVKF